MSGDDKTTKLLLAVVVVLVGVLSIVAIVIAAVSLGASNKPAMAYQLPSNGGGSSSQGSSAGGNTGSSTGGNVVVNVPSSFPVAASGGNDKTWMIAVGHDWGAMEYIDESGYLRGFQFELIAEVCAAANIQCRTVWEPYRNCHDSEPGQHPYGGKGLMGKWYDACTGWLQTVGRSQIFDFSMPWFKDEPAFFWSKKGSGFNWKDVRGKTFGFLDGWWTDEKCLGRMPNVEGAPIPVDKIKHYQTTPELIAAVKNGEIDVAFGAELVVIGDDDELEKTGDGFLCSVAGASMMTRKDNTFAAHWNRGFQTIVSNGRFRKLCDEGKDKHEKDGRKLSECI